MSQLIIIKSNIREIKKFCEEKGINYEFYNSPFDYSKLQIEKVKMFSDYGQAMKDKELEIEKYQLEKADEQEEYKEYDQEEWAK